MEFKRFDSSTNNVFKYVFNFGDAVAESVLYRYGSFDERTVLCISVQSGCPVGCVFCGTGKRFIRNLHSSEIIEQVTAIFQDMALENINNRCKKLQIMFMSMGEPMLNWYNVENSIIHLNARYPNAQLLISTIGVNDPKIFGRITAISAARQQMGLQFSLHHAFDSCRDKIIPYRNKMTIRQLRDAGIFWHKETNRPVFLNYCVRQEGMTENEIDRMFDLFSPQAFYLTFSVICSSDETMKDAGVRNMDILQQVQNRFLSEGYNVRIFDPAGQDDIGGGCGQLWYVQQWMNNYSIHK